MIRSPSWSTRRPVEFPIWSRSGMGACSIRRSPSSGGRPCSWPPTSTPPHAPGVTVQLCGDAHLSNFGVFGTPERQMIFDINDFDETLPGPWEWDVKRLAASFEVLGRFRGFSPTDRRSIVTEGVRAYRERISRTARVGTLQAWYDQLEVSRLLAPGLHRGAAGSTAEEGGEEGTGHRHQGPDAGQRPGLHPSGRQGRRRAPVRGRPSPHRAHRGPGVARFGVGAGGCPHQETALLLPEDARGRAPPAGGVPLRPRRPAKLSVSGAWAPGATSSCSSAATSPTR